MVFGKNGKPPLFMRRITLKAKIEQHISLIKRETPHVSLKDIPLMQKKLVDLKQILTTMSDLRQSFRGQRGRLMEAGNRFLLCRLCEAAHAINERHIFLLPKTRKNINRKQIVAPLQDAPLVTQHTNAQANNLLLLSKTNARDEDSYQRDVQAMYTSLQSVHTLYAEIQSLVLRQGEQIEHILTNWENAAIHTELGTHQVEVRVARERVNTKILLMMLITAAIFFATLFMIYSSSRNK